MKKTAAVVIITSCLLPLVGLGLWSLFDIDQTRSETENRMLKTMPVFSFDALFAGTYLHDLSDYYADTFPYRDTLMQVNAKMGSFYYFQSKNDGDSTFIAQHTGVDGGQGENIFNIDPNAGEVVVDPSPVAVLPATSPTPAPSASAKPSQSPSPSASIKPQTSPTPAVFPDKGEAQQAGNVVVFGDRAMEIVYAKPDLMKRYSDSVNALAKAMPNTQTLVMIAPNSGEFYSSESMHSGSTSQKSMIDTIYSQLSPSVLHIDAYDKLQQHTDEYIYFRTDHHWTALGAYYAYTAMCDTLGLTPLSLDKFQSGTIEGFVGSLYNFTAKYPVSKVLKDNPDTLTYYIPPVETTMNIYRSGQAMTDPLKYSMINPKIGKYWNKYICFIGGDNELTHITTGTKNGKSILVVKESYGNALVPFLVSHYQDVYVIDPRKLNGDKQPTFDLPKFAKDKNLTDVLFINYPFMVNSKTYANLLEKLG